MYQLAAVNLALTGAQATEEGFQIVVSPVAFWPPVAGKEPWPALAEGGADMYHPLGFVGMMSGVFFQLGQEVLDLTLDTPPGWTWATVFGRVKPPFQFNEPIPLTLETPIWRCECSAALNHGQELIQERMAPFF